MEGGCVAHQPAWASARSGICRNRLRTTKKLAKTAHHVASPPDPFLDDEPDEVPDEVPAEVLVDVLGALLPALDDELSLDFAPSPPPLTGLAAAGGVVVDSLSPPMFRFLSPDLKSVSYQPPPFSRKADTETCLRSAS
jgi:hypothetical protein